MRYTIITSALTALIASTALAASAPKDPPLNPAPREATTTPLWVDGLQQKTCSGLEWRLIAGVNTLRIWNSDGSVLQFLSTSGAMTTAQALMSAACSPNAFVTKGHTYWVRVNDTTLTVPSATRLVVTYPPVDTKPVFNPAKSNAWAVGMQDKVCSAIEWLNGAGYGGQDAVLWLHNNDDTVVKLDGANTRPPLKAGPYAVSPVQQEAIDSCGPNSAFAKAVRKYRISVVDPNIAIGTPSRILFWIPTTDPTATTSAAQ